MTGRKGWWRPVTGVSRLPSSGWLSPTWAGSGWFSARRTARGCTSHTALTCWPRGRPGGTLSLKAAYPRVVTWNKENNYNLRLNSRLLAKYPSPLQTPAIIGWTFWFRSPLDINECASVKTGWRRFWFIVTLIGTWINRKKDILLTELQRFCQDDNIWWTNPRMVNWSIRYCFPMAWETNVLHLSILG